MANQAVSTSRNSQAITATLAPAKFYASKAAQAAHFILLFRTKTKALLAAGILTIWQKRHAIMAAHLLITLMVAAVLLLGREIRHRQISHITAVAAVCRHISSLRRITNRLNSLITFLES